MTTITALRAACFGLALFTVQAFAKEEFSYGVAEPFKAGDTVCYVGDSITHGGTYHSMVTLFYATRFPDRPIKYWNCGISGDRAAGVMGDEPYRLNIDILGHKPTVATIMLGMNDVGRTDYGEGKETPDFLARRKASLEMYDASMQKLIGALQKSGARVILITPSIYDETTKLDKANPDIGVGRNGALGVCAEKGNAWARQYNTGIVRFWEGMKMLNEKEQAKNPSFTVVGADRVHPGPVGHFVMAYMFLKAQRMPAEVAYISLDARSGGAIDSRNCQIENVISTAGGMEFDCLEKALPMVVPAEAKPALALVPFQYELNREPLTVFGLAAGNYVVKIDGQLIGKFTEKELGGGVDLAKIEKTPQYQQSATATKINADRTRVAATLRGIAAQYYGISRSKVDVKDKAAVQKKLHQQIEAAKAGGKPMDPKMEAIFSDPDGVEKTEKQYEELSAELAKACQPKKHHFSISKE